MPGTDDSELATRPGAVLVPLDGSDDATVAARVGAQLARRLGLPLTLMTATESASDSAAARHLDAIAATLPVEVARRLVVEHADAADAIAKVALDLDEPLICMTTHGRSGIRWAVLGSVAEEMLTKSARPVVLVGPHCVDPWTPDSGRIMICHDGSEIPAGLLETASAWADTLDAPVTVATVVHPLDVESAERPERVFHAIAERLNARGRAADTELIRSRYAAGALADCAEATPTTLLVMATHRRHGLARAAIGSTTIATVGLAPCPVVVVAPNLGSD